MATKTTELNLYSIQVDAFKALNDNNNQIVVFSGGIGCGKSRLSSYWLLYMCLTYPGTRYLVGRKRLVDLTASVIPSVLDCAEQMGITHLIRHDKLRNYMYVTRGNGKESTIIFRSLDADSDKEGISLGSIELTAAIVEEAGEVSKNVIQTLLQRLRYRLDEYGITGKLLIICNPSLGFIYNDWYMPWKKGLLPADTKFFQATPHDNPFLSKSYLSKLTRENLGDWAYETRVLLNWEYRNENADLFSPEDIDNAFYRDIEGIDTNGRYITVDVAGTGSDKTALTLWNGLHLTDLWKFSNLTAPEAARLIHEKAKENGVSVRNIVIDANGVGSGLADLVPGCVRWMSQNKALNAEGYASLKDQAYYKLADYLRLGKIKFDCHQHRDAITKELLAHKRYQSDNDKYARVTPKAKVMNEIGYSPDLADAISMRMYFLGRPTTHASLEFIR